MKIEKLICPSCHAPLTGDFLPNQKIECSHCGTALLLTNLDSNNPIFCPNCGTLNTGETRFCMNCEHKLKVDCILCHEQNRIDTVYCVNCGAHIERARQKRRHLREMNNQRRQERLEALKAKEAQQQQARLERLLDALDEPENHDYAINQINEMGMAAVNGLIKTLLHDQDVDARYGSARALGQILVEQELRALDKGRTAAIKALIKALSDPETPVRYWAAVTLGYCGSNLALSPLASLLDDDHEGVRQEAQKALQKIGGPRAEKILAEHKPKRSWGWFKR